MQTRTLFSPAQHSPTARSRYTTLDAFELAVGARLPSQGFPEERLWIFTDGRGMLNVYGDPGDQYDIRQTTALWTTPSIETEIWNTGPRPLHGVIFRVGDVPESNATGYPGPFRERNMQRYYRKIGDFGGIKNARKFAKSKNKEK